MPTIAISKDYDFEPVIAQAAYNKWFFQNSQSSAANQYEALEFSDIGIIVNEQLEIFGHEIALDDDARFKLLIESWHDERGATSSITDMILCPSYSKIIGMGPRAINLILGQLVSEGDDPDHWFFALQALTGANPVPQNIEGNLLEMSRAWLLWARVQGYVW